MSASSNKKGIPASASPDSTNKSMESSQQPTPASNEKPPVTPNDNRRWWIRLFIQPALLLTVGVILFVALGIAQRSGFLSVKSTGSDGHVHVASGSAKVRYICPMMCTPPQDEPGRCPVCGMELVPTTSGVGNSDSRSIYVDPVARRIANIDTVAVASVPVMHTVRSIGELSYDEGTLKTIAAYVDGRLDQLYADYTGVVVQKGDPLALVYSPRLYSGQVELLLAKKSMEETRSSTLAGIRQSNEELYATTRRRLIELGMTESQVAKMENTGEANSRLHLLAPISGTVIEKLAVEGQYVKEGDAIYRLADLSTVWLMLELFPEDAASIRYGQKVNAEVQSLPGQLFTGRAAFIDPNVDPKTRTVGVRVVIPNADGNLRVGDFAKATIDVPLSASAQTVAYDPELADKWISPRHPHVVSDTPGKCPICGVDLVPAAEFGFTAQPGTDREALVVPRDAVLMAGNNSVLYVETEPGRFEVRRVVLGPAFNGKIVIRSGVEPGEYVATRGNFLIDSQMQLAGNPSLIDPTRLDPTREIPMTEKMIAALSGLSPEDRSMVEKQVFCPVAEFRLGSMGPPQRVDVNGSTVFICCKLCRADLLAEPDKYLAKLEALSHRDSIEDDAVNGSPQSDLPPIGIPQLMEPDGADDGNFESQIDAANTAGSEGDRIARSTEEMVR